MLNISNMQKIHDNNVHLCKKIWICKKKLKLVIFIFCTFSMYTHCFKLNYKDTHKFWPHLIFAGLSKTMKIPKNKCNFLIVQYTETMAVFCLGRQLRIGKNAAVQYKATLMFRYVKMAFNVAAIFHIATDCKNTLK